MFSHSCAVPLQELVRQVLSAIRAVAGNDDVKDAVVNAGGVQLIVAAMNRHMGNWAVSQSPVVPPGVDRCQVNADS